MKQFPDEAHLIDRILAGDTAAQRTLVERHKGYAYTIAYRVLQHRENAEEAAQDAFLQAFRNLAGYNRASKFSTWFYRIVFNAALMARRRQKPAATNVEAARLLAAPETAGDALGHRERRQHIAAAFEKLLPEDAAVLTLFYLKELSLDEIAEITGATVAATKVRLHRARQRMAAEMTARLKTEAGNLY